MMNYYSGMIKNACQRFRFHVPVRYLKAEGIRVPDLHEPSYLEELKPKVGFYKLLNLQLRGYDYVILEKYQSYLHRAMERTLNLKTTNAWSAPRQELQVEILVSQSNAIDSDFVLKLYERNIQMKDALSTQIPILIDLVHSTLPQGVTFSIDRHTQADEDKLYFKDSILENLKEELQELKDTPLIGI